MEEKKLEISAKTDIERQNVSKMLESKDMRKKPVLSVDFDGVIHSYKSGWQGALTISDPPTPGALEFLKRATDSFEINIYSSRSHVAGGIDAMKAWLWREAEKEYNSTPAWLEKIVFPEHKPSAFLIIDDRAFCFEGRWPTMGEIFDFRPWYKRRPV